MSNAVYVLGLFSESRVVFIVPNIMAVGLAASILDDNILAMGCSHKLGLINSMTGKHPSYPRYNETDVC